MEANEGKYTFGAVIPGSKLEIWVFWWSYLGRNISENNVKETSCFRACHVLAVFLREVMFHHLRKFVKYHVSGLFGVHF